MTSESARSILERLINSRTRDFSPLISLILGFTTSETDPNETRVESPESEPDPDDDSANRSSPGESTRQERNRNLSLFLNSLILGSVTDPNEIRVGSPESEPDPDENSANRSSPDESTHRVASRNLSFLSSLILGFTTTETDPNETRVESPGSEPDPFESPTNRSRGSVTVVIVGGGGQGKGGYPPAARSAVEMMPRVEVREGDEVEERECVICLEEMRVMKKMPCQHVFHEECIVKWLGIHGTCPTCRFKMPVDDDVDGEKSEEREGVGQRVNREFWVRVTFGGRSDRSGGGGGDGDDQTVQNEPNV
ncbi:hypothetical protein vseg_019922 [Gypsophila vaccaria]